MCSTNPPLKVAEVKVYPRQTWNFRSHAVSACIGLWHHRPMHAPHRLMHTCTAYIAPWCLRPMHVVTAWALLFWYYLWYTFISSYFALLWCSWLGAELCPIFFHIDWWHDDPVDSVHVKVWTLLHDEASPRDPTYKTFWGISQAY